MKKMSGIFLLICFLGMLTACGNTIELNLPEDGYYFMEWDSYLGYSDQEKPEINLAYIEIHRDGSPSEDKLNNVILLSDQGEINVDMFSVTFDPGEKEYTLKTIYVDLPALSAGRYLIKDVKIIWEDLREEVYPIGSWLIEVRDEVSSDLTYQERAFRSNLFGRFFAEVTNHSTSDIEISELFFTLEREKPIMQFTSSANYDDKNKSGDRIIPAGEMRFLDFEMIEYSQADNFTDFIAIRPFLVYSCEEKISYATTFTFICSPAYIDDQINQLLDTLQNK